MNLADRLRQAEEQGKAAVHHGAEKVHKIESALRRKLKKSARVPVSSYPDPEVQRENAANPEPRTGIVSVNGRDVEQMRCTGGRRSA